MVYNRCVGTRFCSNNCPYKVRRFNFLEYSPPASGSVARPSGRTPNVTVRRRGVMEKCTYCVQRHRRGPHSGPIWRTAPSAMARFKTACQQACPAEAIVFRQSFRIPPAAFRRRKARAGELRAPGSRSCNTQAAHHLPGTGPHYPHDGMERRSIIARVMKPHDSVRKREPDGQRDCAS